MAEEMENKNEFSLMERADEEQIVAELQGEALREMVYLSQGKTILTWAGIKQLAYKQGGIDVDLVSREENPESIIITVKATDKKNQSSMLGVSTQSKTFIVKGKPEPDQFALQKAMSKAQRNAIRALLPEVLIQKSIEAFMNQSGAVKEISQQENGQKLKCSCGGGMIPSKFHKGYNYCFKCKKETPDNVDIETGEVIDIGEQEIKETKPDKPIVKPDNDSKSLIRKAHFTQIKQYVSQLGYTNEQMKKSIKERYGVDDSAQLTDDDVEELKDFLNRQLTPKG